MGVTTHGASSQANIKAPRFPDEADDKREEGRWVSSPMAFANPCYVFPDPHRGGAGNRLILPQSPLPYEKRWDLREIRIRDLAPCGGRAPGGFEPDLFVNGFAIADLDGLLHLQGALEQVASQGHVGPAEITALQRAIVGMPIKLGAGHALQVLEVDAASLFMRKSGPGGMSLGVTDRTKLGFRPTGRTLAPAVNVHTDGDVDSTKRAPSWKERFNHSGNPSSEMFVLNLWIPLQQPVRPLAVMDCSTLDRERDQVKQMFTLPDRVDGEFLYSMKREDEPQTAENHTILHHPSQEWYFKSDLGPRQALVFDTMSTPHGAFLLPGEAELAQLFRQLERAQAALAGRGAVGVGALTGALWPDAEEASVLCPGAASAPAAEQRALPLRRLIHEMEDLVQEGRSKAGFLCRAPTAAELRAGVLTQREDYLQRISAVLERSQRKSVEIRCSAIVRRQGWLAGGPHDVSLPWLRLPPALDKLGLIEIILQFKIPGLKVSGWFMYLVIYLIFTAAILIPYGAYAAFLWQMPLLQGSNGQSS